MLQDSYSTDTYFYQNILHIYRALQKSSIKILQQKFATIK